MESYSVSPLSNADLRFHELLQPADAQGSRLKAPRTKKQIVARLRKRKERRNGRKALSASFDDGDDGDDVTPWELVTLALQEVALAEEEELTLGDEDEEDRVLSDSYNKSAELTASTTLSFADDLRRKSASLVKALVEQRECAAQLAAVQDLLQRDTGDLGYQRDWSKAGESAREDFLATALMYGKVVVAELPMKNAHRTIKVNTLLGGVLGGAKYLFHGMLIKWAPDNPKAAGHELKALRQISGTAFNRPLFAKLQYRGYTISIQSVLPITPDTLVHGSSDGGKTHRRDKEVEQLLRPMLDRLGLAKGPFDAEFHRTGDGKIHCVDLHRLAPAVEQQEETRTRALYRFEFLSHYAAQKKIGQLQSDQVKPRTAQLLQERVREYFAREHFGADLTEDMHAWGLNVRHLAHLWRHEREGGRVLREMAARLAKHRVWALQRQQSQQLLSSMRACNAAAATVLGDLGKEHFWASVMGSQSVFQTTADLPGPALLAGTASPGLTARVCQLAGIVVLPSGAVECVERIKYI